VSERRSCARGGWSTALLVALAFCACDRSRPAARPADGAAAYAAGRAEAETDLAAGKLGWRQYGLPLMPEGPWRETLAKDYGIDLQVVAGSIVTDDVVQRSAGYNDVMQAAIEKRHGKDVFRHAADRTMQVLAARREDR